MERALFAAMPSADVPPDQVRTLRASTDGDINGDGYDDAMVGASLYTNVESNEGGVYVYLGSSSGLSTTPQTILESNIANAGFGGAIDMAGAEVPDVDGPDADAVDHPASGALRFSRVVPNPSSDATLLHFTSPRRGEAQLTIHDVTGRRVATLLDGLTDSGTHAVRWDQRDDQSHKVPGGTYLARLVQGSAVSTTKLIVRR